MLSSEVEADLYKHIQTVALCVWAFGIHEQAERLSSESESSFEAGQELHEERH